MNRDDYPDPSLEEDPPGWDPWEDPDWGEAPRWRPIVTIELPEENQS